MEEERIKVGSYLKGWDAIVTFISSDEYYVMYEALDGSDRDICTVDYLYQMVAEGEIVIDNSGEHTAKRYIVVRNNTVSGDIDCYACDTRRQALDKLQEWRAEELAWFDDTYEGQYTIRIDTPNHVLISYPYSPDEVECTTIRILENTIDYD